MFQPTSRYYNVEIAEWTSADGRVVRYVRRRFIPLDPSVALAEHTVIAGDRLDNVTARYLADAEQFWRVCDTSRAERPDDVTARPDRVLIIPMPGLR